MAHELLEASDEQIANAVSYGDPMVLRALLHQLTGDRDVIDMKVTARGSGIFEHMELACDDDISAVRQKAVDLLTSYRDNNVTDAGFGPTERLSQSVPLALGTELNEDDIALGIQEMGINPWARSLEWTQVPPDEKLASFSVTVIGAGMAGLNAAIQLKRAGIPFCVLEKNGGVGGTWHENRYPGARVDTASRGYTHLFGTEFPYPYAFCPSSENQKYFDWVADTFDIRGDIDFNTEVRSLTWHEDRAQWEIATDGLAGADVRWSNAVFTAVGFLNRPKVPDFPGASEFEGASWHTARWPEGADLTGKRVGVIGTGSTGYQLVPELALLAGHVTVFQRTPGWLLNVPKYLQLLPEEILWLERHLPLYRHFTRFRAKQAVWMLERIAEIDVDFDDPDACNELNKRTRDGCLAFLNEKLRDPELVARLTPRHPVIASRPIVVDPEYSFLDAILRDDVTLVSGGISRINATGIVTDDGTQHDVDVIVYATGFHATEYLFPMEITGRNDQTVEKLWTDTGAQSYACVLLPGFPNLFMLYGPNTNGGLSSASISEMGAQYALKCIEQLVLNDKRSVTATQEGYERWNAMIDQRNAQKVWSDPRAHNYYWTEFGRSATMNPLYPTEMWLVLDRPDFSELHFD